MLLEQLAQIPHGSVLDVGCGTGELLREVGLRFPETARTGLDLSANMLAVAREKLGGAVELVQGDAERLPFANRRFEVLLCNDSFHHYPNPGAAAAEFARVLQPGGVLLLGDCTAPAGLRGVANLFLPLSGEGDVRLYSGAELAALLEEAAARKGRHAAIRLNRPQAVLEVHFQEAPPAEACTAQEANEGEEEG